MRPWVVLVFSFLASLGAADSAALRALLRIPFVPEPLSLDLAAVRAERAVEGLAKLNPELLADRLNPRLNYRAASYMREMGDPASGEYARRAVDALIEAERARPLDLDQTRLLIEAAIAAGDLELAGKRLDDSKLTDADVATLRGEIAIFRVFEEANVAQMSPAGDRMLRISLEALRNSDVAATWKELLLGAAKDLRRAAQLAPKDARPHRSLAVALVARAYVESAIRWRSEQATTSLMPEEAFAHFKEASNLAPEDVVAQWEAYESRVALERSRGASVASALPKDALKYVATLTKRLQVIATSERTDSRLAAEILGVIVSQGTKPEDALAWFDRARGSSFKPRIEWLRFRLLLAIGKPAEAAIAGEPLLADKSVPEFALALAVAYERAGETERADRLVVESLMKWPGSPELRLARSIALLRDASGAGLVEAGQTLDQLTTVLTDGDPLQDELRFARAVYFGLIGDVDSAKRVIDLIDKKMPARVDRLRKALSSTEAG